MTESDDRYDWECNPQFDSCPPDQYAPITTSPITTAPETSTTYDFTVSDYVTESDYTTASEEEKIIEASAFGPRAHRGRQGAPHDRRANKGERAQPTQSKRPAESLWDQSGAQNVEASDSAFHDEELLKWAMDGQNNDISGANLREVKERSREVAAREMLNDLVIDYEDEPESKESEEIMNFEEEFEQNNDDWAMMAPVNNIVNFYNGNGMLQRPHVTQFERRLSPGRAYPIASQMMNDVQQFGEEPQEESFRIVDAKLNKRVRCSN